MTATKNKSTKEVYKKSTDYSWLPVVLWNELIHVSSHYLTVDDSKALYFYGIVIGELALGILIRRTIPENERWLFKNKQALKSVADGIADAKARRFAEKKEVKKLLEAADVIPYDLSDYIEYTEVKKTTKKTVPAPAKKKKETKNAPRVSRGTKPRTR